MQRFRSDGVVGHSRGGGHTAVIRARWGQDLGDRSGGRSSRSRQLRHVGHSSFKRASSGSLVALLLPLVRLCIMGGEMPKPVLEPRLDRSALARIEISALGPCRSDRMCSRAFDVQVTWPNGIPLRMVQGASIQWILVVGTIAAPYSRWHRIARDRYKL